VYNLVPDTFGVCGKSVRGYPSVVLRLEDREVRLVNETALLGVIVSFLEA
jgi:hypothetical protein